MSTETELKLSIKREDARRVSRLAPIRKYAAGKAQRRRLFSVYYDTPELDLLHRAMVLRLRRVGGLWIQCVKTGGCVGGGLHRREEYEVPVVGPDPDYESLPDRRECDVLRAPKTRQRLRPVFVTEFWRTTWDLEFPQGTQIECALDEGDVRTDDGTTPIHEIELELKHGLPERLYDLALEIAESLDVRIENTSKAQTGYRMIRPVEIKAVKSAPVALDPAMTVEDALSGILWSCLGQVEANERVVLEGNDMEGVHQMRVGLRRLRSALRLFRGIVPPQVRTQLMEDWRRVTGPLGPARDWDVFLAEHLRPMVHDLPDDHPMLGLRARAEQRRRDCYAKLRTALRSRAYNRAVLRIAGWVARKQWREALGPEERERLLDPVGDAARRVLTRGHKRVTRRGAGIEDLDEPSLHRLRIEIKRQRYAAEFLASLFSGKAPRRYRKALCGLQDLLGRLNDATMARRLLGELADVDDPEARSFVEGWHARARVADHALLSGAWSDFTGQKRYWK